MAKDTKDGNNLNEKSYVNKKLLQCYLIISMVLLAAYIMELVKGNRTAVSSAFIILSSIDKAFSSPRISTFLVFNLSTITGIASPAIFL